MPRFCACDGGPSAVRDPIYDTHRCLTCGHDIQPVRIAPSTRRLALAIAAALMESGSRVGAARNPQRLGREAHRVPRDRDGNRYRGSEWSGGR